MKKNCEFCSTVDKINEMSGKCFYKHFPSIYKRDAGHICIAKDGAGRYVIHYEDESDETISMVGAQIAFCPICGRRLMND